MRLVRDAGRERVQEFAALLRSSRENRVCLGSLGCWLVLVCCLLPVVALVVVIVGSQEVYTQFVAPYVTLTA